jgi:hypothetical protein
MRKFLLLTNTMQTLESNVVMLKQSMYMSDEKEKLTMLSGSRLFSTTLFSKSSV